MKQDHSGPTRMPDSPSIIRDEKRVTRGSKGFLKQFPKPTLTDLMLSMFTAILLVFVIGFFIADAVSAHRDRKNGKEDGKED